MLLLNKGQERSLEVALVIVVIGLAALLQQVGVHTMAVLNLFYLPVGLGALFLGRYRAGVLALFCVVAAGAISLMNMDSLSNPSSPLTTALALTVWAAVMGLHSLLVGTLSDERTATLQALHDAHLGVVEVLSQYLSSADARLRDRTLRIAELSQRVGVELKLSPKEVDDIRVAALLQDLGNFEVTAKVIRRAVDDLSRNAQSYNGEHTFRGSDFAQSLGSVLSGALELMNHRREPLRLPGELANQPAPGELPLGAKILQTVRDFDQLMHEGIGANPEGDTVHALEELKSEVDTNYPPVVQALERVLRSGRFGRNRPRKLVESA